MSIGPTDLKVQIDADASAVDREIARMEATLRRAETTMRRTSLSAAQLSKSLDDDVAAAALRSQQAMSKFGTGMLIAGGAIAAGLGLATREAMRWESAWAGVTKTVTGSDDEMAALEKGLRGLSLVLPSTHDEIAAVAAAAGALGIEQPNILKFTKTMIDLGQATDDLDAQTAATGLAQFMNVVGTGQEDVDRLGASLVALGNNGASTEGQILAMAQRLAAAGKIARFSEGDILGMASALTSVGIDAEAGGSAFSRVFISIDDAVKTGNASLQTFATVAGMSAEQFSTAFRDDAAGATTAFIEGLGRLDESGASLTGTLDELGLSDIRVRNALLSAAGAGDLMREAVELGNDAWADNSALVNEVAKRYETTEAKVAMARNALADAGIEIGQNLLPILASLAGSLSDVLGWFTNLPGPVKALVTGLAGLAAVGGLTVGSIIKIQGAVNKMLTTMEASPKLVGATTTALKAMGAAGIVLGIVALAYALKDYGQLVPEATVDTGKLATALYVLAQSGEDTAGVADQLGMSFDDFADKINHLGDVTDAAEMISLLQQMDALNETLVSMVQGGDADQAAAIVEQLGLNSEMSARLLGPYNDALEEAGARADAAAESTENLTPAQKDLAEQFGLTGTQARTAADDLDEFDRQLGNIMDTLFAGEEAQDNLTRAWQDWRDEIARAAEAGEAVDLTLAGNSAAALENRDRLRELIDDNLKIIATWDQAAMTGPEYDAALASLRQSFIDNATEVGLGQEAVEQFDEAMDLLPAKVDIPVSQPGMPIALDQTLTLHQRLQDLEGTYYTKVVVDIPWGDLEWLAAHLPEGTGGRIASPPAGDRRFGEQSAGSGRSGGGGDSGRMGGQSVMVGRAGYAGPPMVVHNHYGQGTPESVGIDNAHRLAGLVGII